MLIQANIQTKSSAGAAGEFIILAIPYRRPIDKPRILRLANLWVKLSTGVDKYYYDVHISDYDAINNAVFAMASFMTKPHGKAHSYDIPFWKSLRFDYYNTSNTDLIGGNVIYDE